VCPNGHGAMPAGAKFCPVCGAPKVYKPPPAAGSVCASCGTTLVPEASFCPSCGAAAPQLAAPQPATPQPVAPQPATPQPFVPPPSAPPPSAPQPAIPQPVAPQSAGEVRACPNCGRGVPPEATFCGECGHPIDALTPSQGMPVAAVPELKADDGCP
jgi:RNA polymerase subunit RPABC4/transcription elongation factor Spt4